MHGRIPDDAIKAELVNGQVLGKNEEPRLLVGDNVQVAIGQGLMAATPLQLVNAYSALANGGFRAPDVVKTIYAPLAPISAPGWPTSPRRASSSRSTRRRQRPVGDATRDHEPIVNGLARVTNVFRVRNPASPTRRPSTTPPPARIRSRPIRWTAADRRQDRHSAGRRQLPVERLVGLRRDSASRDEAVHGVAYLEKCGFGAKAAARSSSASSPPLPVRRRWTRCCRATHST